MRLCIVQPNRCSPSETFLQAQAERLPAHTTVLHGKRPFRDPHHLRDYVGYVRIRLRRWFTQQAKSWEYTQHCLRLFHEAQPDAVIAQFGPTGTAVMEACRLFGVPLIVHFRGFDVSIRDVLEQYSHDYMRLFQAAAAIIAVSESIKQRLLTLGAPHNKVHCNPSGADCKCFFGSDPANADPTFLAVGRFVEKKSPHLTIMAFAEVYQKNPQVRLRMIGDGPLLGFCQELTKRLRVHQAVTFLGAQTHDVVQAEMRRSRAFVQHSVAASTGDSEGTPVAVMEAGASGLPVVSTRHAGIPDVVMEGKTGFLVKERDVVGMAACMSRLARDAPLARQMGIAARERIERHFSQEQSLQRLWSVIQMCVQGNGAVPDAANQFERGRAA